MLRNLNNFFFLSFVDCSSLYNLVNKAKLVHSFSYHVYFFSIHVSGDYVPIIRRNNCMYATLGTCYSVWMTLWYAYQTVRQCRINTVVSPDNGHIFSRNM